MKLKKFFSLLAVVLAVAALSLCASAVDAIDVSRDIDITFDNIRGDRLLDGDIATSSSGRNVTITIESTVPLEGVWLRYSAAPEGGLLNGSKRIGERGFWSEYIPLGDENAVLTFKEVSLCEINVYSRGTLPSEVQCWDFSENKADLMLFSAHSDDDQLFFAGLIPYYTSKENVEVKVCVFTTPFQQISRMQELLAGLWHSGLRNYPIILPLPDDWSESYDEAKTILEGKGFTYDVVSDGLREVLNTAEPSVIVLHDLAGEYGHGMHIFSAQTVLDTVADASESDFVPSKIYSHLYNQNEITLPIDESLEAFGGKSAFNVSQEGFRFHKSQHWTWFYNWIYGEDGEITASSQIETYNPAKYGLYMSLVGEDSGNDMLENIETHYDRKERLAKAESEAVYTPIEDGDGENPNEDVQNEELPEKKNRDFKYLILPIALSVAILLIVFVVYVFEERDTVSDE